MKMLRSNRNISLTSTTLTKQCLSEWPQTWQIYHSASLYHITNELSSTNYSHSIAAGMNTLCALNHLPGEASETAELREIVDQLFNAFNTASITYHHKYKKTAEGLMAQLKKSVKLRMNR